MNFYIVFFGEESGRDFVYPEVFINILVYIFSLFTPLQGIQHQGSNAIYLRQQLHKGHLFAAMTASGLPQNAQAPLNAQTSARSTYQYTNAVPQSAAFNTGEWRVWEGRIRTYAANICIPAQGVLYLITGVSFVGINNANPPQAAAVPITTLPPVPAGQNNPAAIDKPNSMWTAAICVLAPGGQAYSFAVIGNNVQNAGGMLTQKITLAQLEAILQFDIQTNGLKRSIVEVNLFPGIKKSKNYKKALPEDKYPESAENE